MANSWVALGAQMSVEVGVRLGSGLAGPVEKLGTLAASPTARLLAEACHIPRVVGFLSGAAEVPESDLIEGITGPQRGEFVRDQLGSALARRVTRAAVGQPLGVRQAESSKAPAVRRKELANALRVESGLNRVRAVALIDAAEAARPRIPFWIPGDLEWSSALSDLASDIHALLADDLEGLEEGKRCQVEGVPFAVLEQSLLDLPRVGRVTVGQARINHQRDAKAAVASFYRALDSFLAAVPPERRPRMVRNAIDLISQRFDAEIFSMAVASYPSQQILHRDGHDEIQFSIAQRRLQVRRETSFHRVCLHDPAAVEGALAGIRTHAIALDSGRLVQEAYEVHPSP